MNNKQLIFKTDEECDLSFKYPLPSNQKNENNFSGIPLILHSNHSICWEATDFILNIYNTKPTTAKSTIEKYARQLSRIIVAMDYLRLTFKVLADSDLFLLVEHLQNPKFSKSNRIPGNNQINSIIYRLFSLLTFLQNEDRVNKDKISTSPQIRADINIVEKTFTPNGSKHKQTVIEHPALLQRQNGSKRRPIMENAIQIMHKAIFEFTDNNFIQERWSNLLQTMESTGARESEIAILKVANVNEALDDIKKKRTVRLAITTTKGGNKGIIRKVPVTKEFINELNQFILFIRNPMLAAANINHDYVFITNKCNPMTGKRIYDHFKEVRDITNLKKSDAAPHLFRHRFISKNVKVRLKTLFKKHGNYKTGIESFVIKKVKLLTGHKSDTSIWPYVDDAMYELDSFKEIDDELLAQDEKILFERKIQKLLAKAAISKTVQAKAQIMDQLLKLKLFP
tara:strand:- start:19489 stop:20850 length:1362 start_codon:yes stop_codon:yes gene_type:complete